jgi:hypothetical protein
MERLQEPSEEVVLELQQMLDIPIEDQAAPYELNLLSGVLTNGINLLNKADNSDETCEILRQMIKSAFVIGRRHFSQLL